MCGIAGVYALGDRPPDPAWGELFTRAMAHRGPDGHDVYADHRVVLAHRRLSIIDLSQGGRQPMQSADGRHVITQNGEIYNYRDLRSELEAEGVELRTHSDTEVLLELMARRGTPGLEALRGMFAFGLYDRESGEMLLARDRLGKKPIVWVQTDEWFAFASEVQALLQLPFVRARLDPRSLQNYLELMYVPSPHTLLEGVHKLPAASWLRVAGRSTPQVTGPVRYWAPPEADPRQQADAPWFEELESLLVESARLRTVSDVPIGVFLSGGVDSNVILEHLSRAGHKPIRTYTVGFEGLADERALAKIGADRFSDQHTELAVRADLERDIPEILRHFGEPVADSAIVNTALISREASKHVKVILNGDGGDELFGGYGRFSFARRFDQIIGFPGARQLIKLYYHGRRDGTQSHAFNAFERGGIAAAVRALNSITQPGKSAAMLRDGVVEPWPIQIPFPIGQGLTGAEFAWEGGLYLPDDLLIKVDVASMAWGLENRSPLLDHRLFEHVARLPASRRSSNASKKWILRKLARGRIPDAVLDAPKRGFGLPLHDWLPGPLSGWLDDLVGSAQAITPAFRPGALRRELEMFRSGTLDPYGSYRMWTLAVLEFWAREFSVEVSS